MGSYLVLCAIGRPIGVLLWHLRFLKGICSVMLIVWHLGLLLRWSINLRYNFQWARTGKADRWLKTSARSRHGSEHIATPHLLSSSLARRGARREFATAKRHR